MNREGHLGPDRLMQWLAARPQTPGFCVECGAGTGELTAFLAPRFGRSLATDRTPPKPALQQVEVFKSPAERLPLEADSVDLLFSMQALHHFDHQRHVVEAKRVLRQGGVFAALCWGEMILPPQVAAAYEPIFDCISPYWESARDWVLSGYEGLSFPGTPIKMPHAIMRRKVTLEKLDAELAAWSAIQRALAADVEFPDLTPISDLPAEQHEFEVCWPILGQVFRRTG